MTEKQIEQSPFLPSIKMLPDRIVGPSPASCEFVVEVLRTIIRYPVDHSVKPGDVAKFYSGEHRLLEHKKCLVSAAQGMIFESIEEAEDYVISRASKTTIAPRNPSTAPPEATFVGDMMANFAILINRQANLIAARSRRGAGNVIMMNPKTVNKYLRNCGMAMAAYVDNCDDPKEKIGRWTRVGCINSSMSIWTGDHLPEDKVIIAYKGPGVDGSAVMVTNYGVKQNQVSLIVPDDVLPPYEGEGENTTKLEDCITEVTIVEQRETYNYSPPPVAINYDYAKWFVGEPYCDAVTVGEIEARYHNPAILKVSGKHCNDYSNASLVAKAPRMQAFLKWLEAQSFPQISQNFTAIKNEIKDILKDEPKPFTVPEGATCPKCSGTPIYHKNHPESTVAALVCSACDTFMGDHDANGKAV